MDTKLEIRKLYDSLSSQEQNELLETLVHEKKVSDLFNTEITEQQANKIHSCPHCKSEKIIGWGSQKGKPRYKCTSCNRTFNPLTGTALSYIKKLSEFRSYIHQMDKESSLRDAAKELGISLPTSFNWRHKILSALEDDSSSKMHDIVEADEAFFLISDKGSKELECEARKRGGKAKQPGTSKEQVNVLVGNNREGNKHLSVSNLGRISQADLDRVFTNKISKNAILCSDSNKAYTAWCNQHEIEHKAINASKKQYVKERVFHIQHVNNDIMQLKQWLEFKFHGVATRYLQNYLKWNRYKHKLKNSINSESIWIKEILKNNDTILKFKTNIIRYQTLKDELYYPLFT